MRLAMGLRILFTHKINFLSLKKLICTKMEQFLLIQLKKLILPVCNRVGEEQTFFHAEGLCSLAWHLDYLHFNRRPRGRIKLLQPGCCKVKVSEREIFRS